MIVKSDSRFYEIWLMQSLNSALKQHLLSASANALRILNNKSDLRISFHQLHKIHKRALPLEMMKYRLSIQLYKVYNDSNMNEDWMDMNVQQNFNSRLTVIQINDFSNLKIGKNILANRFGILNNTLTYDCLNLSLISFKLHSKKLFLTSN